MRLLNTKTWEQQSFVDDKVPQYAILSHTWDADEVVFHDYQHGLAHVKTLQGWDKIAGSCLLAAELGYLHIWIDSCCIDKSSSAELSEAINSMYRWYEPAGVCIAYLADAETADTITSSRWFTRGWTLQELIAPRALRFYGAGWRFLGTRQSLTLAIETATQIPRGVLYPQDGSLARRRKTLAYVSVAQKMSWAANRATTRAEDWAYSLLGLFDIHMPLLYGEGQVRAFRRLQEEIIKSTDDETIYAWHLDPMKQQQQQQHQQQQPDAEQQQQQPDAEQQQQQPDADKQHYWGILATTPDAFGHFGDLIPVRPRYLGRRSAYAFSVTNRGVHAEFAITPFPTDKSGAIFLAFLNCEVTRIRTTTTLTPAIILQKTSWDSDSEFVRICPDVLALFMMNKVALPETLADRMRDENHRPVSLQEPGTRRIFVPRDLVAPRSPSGFVFVPEISDAREQPFDITVTARSPTWQIFSSRDEGMLREKESQDKDDVYVIAFDVNRAPEVADLHKAQVSGSVSLLFSREKGWSSWAKCITVGLEPLEENPFKTPPLYFAPFLAFQSREEVQGGQFENALDRSKRETEAQLGVRVVASVELERRFNWLAYRVKLRVGDVRT